MEATQLKTVKIGFWIRDGKWKNLQLDRLNQIAQENESFDIEVFQIRKAEEIDLCTAVVIKQKDFTHEDRFLISERLQATPHVIQVDPMPDTLLLSDRNSTFDKLKSLEHHLVDLKVMPSFTLNTHADLASIMHQNSLIKFPLICKPNMLCGTDSDHEMFIVFDVSQLRKLDVKLYCFQPLVRHSVLLKTFVIGREHYVAVRPNINKMIDEGEFKGFNTFIVKTLERNPNLPGTGIDDEVISRMTEVIGTTFNLSLYGVDIIIGEDGTPYIIDLNIFPGYAEMISTKGIDYVQKALLKLILNKVDDALPL